MTNTLTIRLQTALRGIFAAVDSLGPHPSRHCPRAVLDAVEDARKIEFEDSPQLPDRPGKWEVQGPNGWARADVWRQWDLQLFAHLDIPGSTPSSVDWLRQCGWRNWRRGEAEHVAAVERPSDVLLRGILADLAPTLPAKRRIHLCGGPLDGCWYVSRPFTSLEMQMRRLYFVLTVPNQWANGLRYSLPDADGICHFLP